MSVCYLEEMHMSAHPNWASLFSVHHDCSQHAMISLNIFIATECVHVRYEHSLGARHDADMELPPQHFRLWTVKLELISYMWKIDITSYYSLNSFLASMLWQGWEILQFLSADFSHQFPNFAFSVRNKLPQISWRNSSHNRIINTFSTAVYWAAQKTSDSQLIASYITTNKKNFISINFPLSEWMSRKEKEAPNISVACSAAKYRCVSSV